MIPRILAMVISQLLLTQPAKAVDLFGPSGQVILGYGQFDEWFCDSLRFDCLKDPYGNLYQFEGESMRPGTLSRLCFDFHSILAPKDVLLTVDENKKIRVWKVSSIIFGFDEVKYDLYDCPV